MNLFLPQAALAAGTMGALGLGLFRRPNPLFCRLLVVFVPLIALSLVGFVAPVPHPPLFHADLKSLGWQLVIYAAALPLALRSSGDDVEAALFLGALLGMGLLSVSANLPMLFVSLEFMSLPAYLLVARAGRAKGADQRLEAAVKYFFAGALSGSLFLLGLALYYAATGSLGPSAVAPGPLGQGGLALMASAALFKIGVVPLHWWLPDVYEASAPEVAGFLSTSMKSAATLFLLRLVQLSPAPAFSFWLPGAGAATALIGAVLALRQNKLQRLLAYSSLAHAGFLVLGVGAWDRLGRDPQAALAILFYLGAYAFMSNGAFAFLSATGVKTRADLRGLASRRPRAALAFAVLLFALAGTPPTAGFTAKLLIFWQAIRGGLYWPAGVAALAALISLGYYLGLVRDLYFEESAGGAGQSSEPYSTSVLTLGALGALILGLSPFLFSRGMGGLW